jgi:hypothetical protein
MTDSFAVTLITRIRDGVRTECDIQYREKIAVIRTLNIILEALTNGPQPSPSPETSTKPR